MRAALVFQIVVIAYFAIVWALLRVFTQWETKPLLLRSAVAAVVCNAPLLIGGPVGIVLIGVYDTSFLGGVLPIAAGTVASVAIGVDDIVLVTLKRGIASERTTVLACIGVAFIAFSVWILIGIVRLLFEGGVPYEFEMAFVLLGPVGAGLLYLAFRKRFYLLVQTRTEARKLAFGPGTKENEAQQFLERLRPALSCPVRSAVE